MKKANRERQLQSLVDRLSAMSVKPPRKKRRSRKAKSTPGTSGSVTAPTASVSGSQAEIRVRKREMLLTLKTDSSGAMADSVVLHPTNFGWLSNLSKSFERMRWNSLRVSYVPAVGSTVGGTVAMGFDYAFKKFSDRKKVLALSPSAGMPVWQAHPGMSIPKQMLQSRAWYLVAKTDIDGSPGAIDVVVESAVSSQIGDLWIDYDIEFAGAVFP